jgi:ABC-type sugar transport system permease subunit
LGAAAWNGVIAAACVLAALDIFSMDTLRILGKPADLGRPVQVFAGAIVLLPALLAVLGGALLLMRRGAGRYLSLAVNVMALTLAVFGLLGRWGLWDSFERLVDGVMRAPYLVLGFALAYALFWLAGRVGAWLQLAALGVGGLTLLALFLSAGLLAGLQGVAASLLAPQTYLYIGTALASGFFIRQLIRLGPAFGETPDGRNAWQGWFMLAPNILGFLFFFAAPLLLSFYLSFTNSSVGRVPQVTGLDNYARLMSVQFRVLDDPAATPQSALDRGYAVVRTIRFGETRLVFGARDRLFWISLWNTLLFCLMLLPLAILPALGMAMILNSSLPGVQFFRALYFLPSVAAVVGTALIWRWLYTPTTGFISYAFASVSGFFGLPDPQIQWLSDPRVVLVSVVLLSAWQVVGYNVVLFLAGLQGVPRALHEAAKIDGANGWQRFRNVTMPMLAPTTFFVVITTMVTGLQVFNEPYALFPSRPIPENATTLVYYLYTQGFNQFQFGYASSIAWVLFALIFSFTFIQFRMSRSQAYG